MTGMTEPDRCQICGAEIPATASLIAMDGRFRGVVFERKLYYFCPHHTWSDIDLWIAETLICDREHLRYLHRLYGMKVPA
ncbi:hypothetical protein DSECCO2_213070 [anaerobic digester metagenome]